MSTATIEAATPLAYDFDEACDICASRPLEEAEGIWIYPEDNVTVMILKNSEGFNPSTFPTYQISVVQGSDCRLEPGDILGSLTATSDENIYKIELFTEKKKEILLQPVSCLAKLSKDGDVFTITKSPSKLKLRLNLNLTRLLPSFWKIVSSGVNTNPNNTKATPPIGMVKIFPSYDGNGSSRRKIRYL